MKVPKNLILLNKRKEKESKNIFDYTNLEQGDAQKIRNSFMMEKDLVEYLNEGDKKSLYEENLREKILNRLLKDKKQQVNKKMLN